MRQVNQFENASQSRPKDSLNRPTAEVNQGKDGPTEVGYTKRINAMQEQYIHGLLNGRRITHFYSSELYGEHMSEALQAVNRVVGKDRLKLPVSGTAIRKDPGNISHSSIRTCINT